MQIKYTILTLFIGGNSVSTSMHMLPAANINHNNVITDSLGAYVRAPEDTNIIRPDWKNIENQGYKFTAIRATEQSTNVIYEYNNGQSEMRIGGSRAWRNNNPGNIVVSPFATDHGAIGRGGKFAVFPDEQTGMQALCSLLRGRTYSNMTIERAISKYCPTGASDINLYRRKLAKLTGLSLNRRLSTLSDAELNTVASSIKTIEGWKPGKITPLSATRQIAQVKNMKQKMMQNNRQRI